MRSYTPPAHRAPGTEIHETPCPIYGGGRISGLLLSRNRLDPLLLHYHSIMANTWFPYSLLNSRTTTRSGGINE